MKHCVAIIFRLICVAGLLTALAPRLATASDENIVTPYDDISPAEEQAMLEEIRHNITQLRQTGQLAAPDTAQAVTYNFPLRLAPGLPDYAGFRVSAFADHHIASGQILDYNGGTRTYDGHHGTDYALWPFGWNKLDASAVQVIAAAAGTIVAKADTNPADHNCGSSSGGNWNYVALVHGDGRMTIYGHMRHNSLTSKGIGQTVTQSEYLGTAASSGNSSGPHLHFEVRTASFSAEWIDPYAGPNSQAESLWTNQRPYFDAAINRLATHSAPPSTPDPCQPTITNLQDSFTTPGTIYFYTYYRDYPGTLITDLKIYRPDGSIFQAWQDIPIDNTFYSALSRARAFSLSAGEPAGTWRFTATFNGQAYETFFNVNAPPAITVTSPHGGEQWERQIAHTVTWTDNLGGEVNIALYHNGVYSATLASNLPSNGTYLWTPGYTLAVGPGYTLRVSSVINPAVYDDSNAAFSLSDTHLVARDDFAMTAMNTAVTIHVLGNDGGAQGDPMTITALGPPLSGTASLMDNAGVVYTPTLDSLGTDVFTYTVSASNETASANVTVLVAAQVFRLFLPLIQR